MGQKKFLTGLGLFFLIFMVCLIPFSGVSAVEKTEIRVGAINSITGLNAMTGAECRWAYEQAVADTNEKGGVYVKDLGKKLPIKLIFADDKSTADQAAAAMERLIKVDKIDLAISTNITPLNIAAGTVCEKYKVYFQITCSWLDFIEKENFKWVSDLFTSAPEAARTPFIIWEEQLSKEQRPKRPALMMEDNQDGQGFGMGFKGFAEEYGYKFAVDEPYAPGSKDFSSHILKWKATKADALLWLGSPTDGITLLRQIKEQGLVLPYIHGWKGFWPTEFLEGMGKEGVNYIIHDGFWTEKFPVPGAKELQERFIKQFKKDSVSIGLYYANPQILAMAIEKAGSFESAKVRDAVFGGEFKDTMMGDVKYNEKGLCFKPLIAMQWWNGDRMPIYPALPSVWKLKLRPVK